jgi:two-component system invasion response regulator UvrY
LNRKEDSGDGGSTAGGLMRVARASPQRKSGPRRSFERVEMVSDVRVLVVDDHPGLRAALRELIAGVDGFAHVGDAASGEAALELAERLRPDLVLLDVQLPGIDGLEVCRRLTAMVPRAVVVLMTADPASVAADAADCGAATLVRKQDLRRRLLRELWDAHRPEPPSCTAT